MFFASLVKLFQAIFIAKLVLCVSEKRIYNFLTFFRRVFFSVFKIPRSQTSSFATNLDLNKFR